MVTESIQDLVGMFEDPSALPAAIERLGLEKGNTLASFLLHKAAGSLPSYNIHSVLSARLPVN